MKIDNPNTIDTKLDKYHLPKLQKEQLKSHRLEIL